MSKISVIVPIYNTEKYLHRCIDSILTQTFTDFELLLIDDGSTDTSGEICDRYAVEDNRIQVFHKDNGGVSSARKIGIMNAKADFICFVDADDYLLNNALQTLLSVYEKGDEIIIGGCFENVNISCLEYVRGLLENKIPWGLWSKLFKRSLFDEKVSSISRYFNIGEDLIMQLMLSHNVNGNIKCIKDVVYFLYDNPQSVTHTRKYSVEYEQQFISKVSLITSNYDVVYSILRLRLNSLRMLVAHGVKVLYDDSWVKQLKKDSIGYPITIIDKVVLNKYYYKLYRLFFIIREFTDIKLIRILL